MPGGRSSNNASVDGRFKFTGKERDVAETGYDYFGARYYNSKIGRWLQVDPMDSKYPGVSPYNYSMNNPLRFIDPNGMESLPPEPDDETSRNVVGEGPNTGLRKTGEELENAGPELKKTPHKLLKSLITLSDVTADASLGATGFALSTGNVPAATDALTVGLVAQGSSLLLKSIDYAVYDGSSTELEKQFLETGLSLGGGVAGKTFTKSLMKETGFSSTLFRSAKTGEFITNEKGNTIILIQKAIETSIGALTKLIF